MVRWKVKKRDDQILCCHLLGAKRAAVLTVLSKHQNQQFYHLKKEKTGFLSRHKEKFCIEIRDIHSCFMKFHQWSLRLEWVLLCIRFICTAVTYVSLSFRPCISSLYVFLCLFVCIFFMVRLSLTYIAEFLQVLVSWINIMMQCIVHLI